MDMRELRYFLAVVEAGSISTAARRLHMTQPPLSQAVARLEKSLGVALLERRPRGVLPTEAGRHLAENCPRLLNDLDAVEAELRALGRGRSGILRLGAEPITLWHSVPGVLRQTMAQTPDVVLDVHDAPPGDLLRMIDRGELDVAVMACQDTEALARRRPEDLVDDGGALPLALALPSGDRAGPDPLPLAGTADRTWLIPRRIPDYPGLPELVDDVFARARFTPHAVVEVSTPHTALSLVASGLGVSIVPASFPGSDLLVLRDVPGGLPPMRAAVVRRRDATPTPVVRRCVEMLLEG